MRLLVCGGGTGGHIYPALAVVAELEAQAGQQPATALEVLWIGTRGEMEEKLVPGHGLRLATIAGGPVVGVPPWTSAMNVAKLAWSLGSAGSLVGRFRPDVLLLTGGYVNVPVALAAKLRRVPAAIYLPDIEPGSAIKLLSRLAGTVATTSEASAAYFPPGKSVTTGYPVRPSLRAAASMGKAEALALFDLEAARPTLFVFGGSRGALSINRALLAILPELLAEAQVIHVSGRYSWAEVAARAEQMPAGQRAYYRPYPYLHQQMGPAFRAADLVVARAGASMLGECPAFALPAVLVPYPHAWRYQKVNADYLVARGAAVRLDDEQMAGQLLPTIRRLLRERDRLQRMAAAARALDRPQAAAALADLLRQLAERDDAGGGSHSRMTARPWPVVLRHFRRGKHHG